jgi:hypothetical protein
MFSSFSIELPVTRPRSARNFSRRAEALIESGGVALVNIAPRSAAMQGVTEFRTSALPFAAPMGPAHGKGSN